MLLAIALLPVIPRVNLWWDKIWVKLVVSASLGLLTLAHYATRPFGITTSGITTAPGLATASAAASSALAEYIPLMVLLSSLFIISSGMRITGDVEASPLTNTKWLLFGAIIANLVGTIGASLLLIRLLLEINRERQIKVHTVCFFIMLVSNIGGLLSPLGNPPLYLGLIMGVPFFWTAYQLWLPWLFVTSSLLLIYFIWDSVAYRCETAKAVAEERETIVPLRFIGMTNLLWLVLAITVAALVDPGRRLFFTNWLPPHYLREALLLLLAMLSYLSTPRQIYQDNRITFQPIAEVAALFLGIFMTMLVPIEILRQSSAGLGMVAPWQYFWASGLLSSFLDNAPTYAIFFQTAGAIPNGQNLISGVTTSSEVLRVTRMVEEVN